MLETWVPLLVTAGAVVAVLIAIVAFWRLVARFISHSASWPELAQQFPASGRPEGRAFGHQAGRVHGVAYQGTLRAIPSSAGFFVEVEAPFSHRHAPLLIPWSAFRELKEYRSVFGWRHYELVLAEDAVFFLWRPAGESVRQYFRGPQRAVPGRTLWPLFTRPLGGR